MDDHELGAKRTKLGRISMLWGAATVVVAAVIVAAAILVAVRVSSGGGASRGRRSTAVLQQANVGYHHFSASLRASNNGSGITCAGGAPV